jgi:hypothetical protein
MRKPAKIQFSFFLALSSIFFLSGCEKYYLSLTNRNVDVNYLASTHVATPDKRQKNPPYGEMIIMNWRVPKEVLEKNPELQLHVLYGDYTQKTFAYPVKKRMGYYTYKDLNEVFTNHKGIITYSAELKLDDGSIYKSWKHQLWVKLIDLENVPQESDQVAFDEHSIGYLEDDESYQDFFEDGDFEEDDKISDAEYSSSSVESMSRQGSVIESEDFIEEEFSDSD